MRQRLASTHRFFRAASTHAPMAARHVALRAMALVSIIVGANGCSRDAHSEPPGEATAQARRVAFDHVHNAWSSLLSRYVVDGQVKYGAMAKSGAAELDAYLSALRDVTRSEYDSWSRDQRLAYWLNAYNAFTVRLILNHYPLRSIRDIGVLPGAAFREQFIPGLGGLDKVISLDVIEHTVLRKEFQEPRIHFAIVCASIGCPALRDRAYVAETLEKDLSFAAAAFIGDPTKNRIDATSRTLRLSSIFDWFEEDFVKAAGTVPAFLARYADPKFAAALKGIERDLRIDYLEYDWALNGQ